MVTIVTLSNDILRQICKFLSPFGRLIFASTSHHLRLAVPKTLYKAFTFRDAVANLAHFELAKSMPKFPKVSTDFFIDLAAEVRSIEVLKWYVQNSSCGIARQVSLAAAKYGLIEVIGWMLMTKKCLTLCGCTLDYVSEDMATLTVQSGNLEAVKLLYAHGWQPKPAATFLMASQMDWSMLTWAKAKNFPWSPVAVMRAAASNGNIALMERLLLDYGCTPENCGGNIVGWAAESGHLQAAQWAHAQKFSLDRFSIEYVISNKHLHVVQWLLLDVGCPWDPFYLQMALDNRDQVMATWMQTTF